MRALFGVVALLLALAVVALVSVKELKSVGHVATAASQANPDVSPVPQMSGSGSVPDQSWQLENKVVNDITKAMNQGAAARQEEADKQ